MPLSRRALAGAALSSLAGATLFACASAPPPPPKPTAQPKIEVVPPAPPPPTVEPAPPPPPPEIGSAFQPDPVEPLPPGAVARCGTTRMRAASPSAVGVSNTGSIYTVDYLSPKYVLRDVTLGKDLATLPSSSDSLIAPDASFVVVPASYPTGLVSFYSIPAGVHLGDVAIPLPKNPRPARPTLLFADTAHIRDLFLSPDGAGLVVYTSDGSAHLVDTASRKLVKTTKLPAKTRITGVSRGGNRAVLEHHEREVGPLEALLSSQYTAHAGYSVIDLRTGATVRKEMFKKPPKDPNDPDATPAAPHAYASFRLSPDGTKVLRYEGNELDSIDVATGKERSILGIPSSSSNSGFGGLGSMGGFGFGLGRSDAAFQVFNDNHALVDTSIVSLEDGVTVTTVGQGFEAISMNGEHVVTRNGHVFDLSSGGPELRPAHDEQVTGIAFLPDNRLLAAAGRLTIWKTDTCTTSDLLPGTASQVVTARDKSVAFVTAAAPLLIDEKGQRRRVDADPKLRLSALAPDGSTLFLGSGDDYQGESKLVARELIEEQGREQTLTFPIPMQGLAVSADGASAAVALAERYGPKSGSLQLLSISGLSTTAQIDIPRAGPLAFAGSDTLVHAPGRDGVAVYAVPTLAEKKRLHHGSCCDAIAVSPDGKLVAGAEDNGFVVWDIASRRLVAKRENAHREDIESLAFSPDGRHLATGSSDTTVLFWDVAKVGVPQPSPKAETRVKDAAAAKAFFGSTSYLFGIEGDGTLESLSKDSRVKVPPLKSVTRVASFIGSHCAVAENKVRCWGSSRGGVLGVPEKKGAVKWSVADIAAPTTLAVTDPVDVQLDGTYACALSKSGDLLCWGRMDYRGPMVPPTKVLGDVKSFQLARDHVCAAAADGTVRCWTRDNPSPTAIGAKDVVAVSGGVDHTCFLDKAGAVQCQGTNFRDQLGDDTGMDSAVPVAVKGLQGVSAIASGPYGTCAIASQVQVHCWGRIGDAHLDHATRVDALDGAQAIRVDDRRVCGLLGDHVDCVDLAPRN